MFEPEYLDTACPKCLHRRVYLDRQIGYYCMACGHELSTRETIALIEKIVLTWPPSHTSDKTGKKSVTEIKELPPRKPKVKHLSHSTVEHKKPERLP
ncbi:MAG: hypothetical protein ACYSWW_09310 [Planctomycetota bacterium]